MSKTVLLAMSGGIDSTAAAVLLQESGYDVTGLTFRINGVSSDSIENASRICSKLGIRHEYIDITERFTKEVMDYFRLEYSKGRTPNPCIKCNSKIKFGYLYDLSVEKGFDFLATGHYASIVQEEGRLYLEKSVDETRDQTYFLYVLKENQLERVLFPLNGISKDKARKICADRGLMPQDSAESREICFIDKDYRHFVEENDDFNADYGYFISSDGKKLGKHDGLHRYTIGQRKGLGLNLGKPVFILKIDSTSGNITIGDEKDLYSDFLRIGNINLINGSIPPKIDFYVKIRYGSGDYEIDFLETETDGSILIGLAEKARAVTPGQSAVIYSGRRVIGGGTII